MTLLLKTGRGPGSKQTARTQFMYPLEKDASEKQFTIHPYHSKGDVNAVELYTHEQPVQKLLSIPGLVLRGY